MKTFWKTVIGEICLVLLTIIQLPDECFSFKAALKKLQIGPHFGKITVQDSESATFAGNTLAGNFCLSPVRP